LTLQERLSASVKGGKGYGELIFRFLAADVQRSEIRWATKNPVRHSASRKLGSLRRDFDCVRLIHCQG
jgi:hypothetical protein